MKKKSYFLRFVETELDLSGLMLPTSDYDGMIGKAVWELARVFSKQGHSGCSAGYVASVFNRLVRYKVISPIDKPADGDYEIVGGTKPGELVFQHHRLSSLFSNDSGKHWHDLDAKLTLWDRLLRRRVHNIKFPYYPK